MSSIVIAMRDEALAHALRKGLADSGYATAEVTPGSTLPRQVAQLDPDLTFIDANAAHGEGPDASCELIRAVRYVSHDPIVMVTDRNDPEETAAMLTAGADDVIDVNIDPRVLGARVRALLRRYQYSATADAQAVIATGELVIDRVRRQVRRGGRQINLTDTEYQLLDALVERAGQTVTAESLIRRLWSDDFDERHQHRLRTYIGYLRRKLGDSTRQPEYIVTDWGSGYRLAMLPMVEEGVAGEPRVTYLSDWQER